MSSPGIQSVRSVLLSLTVIIQSDSNNSMKIGDFGSARITRPKEDRDWYDAATRAYMPPEMDTVNVMDKKPFWIPCSATNVSYTSRICGSVGFQWTRESRANSEYRDRSGRLQGRSWFS